MDKFKYKTECSLHHPFEERELDDLGQDGWELCGTFAKTGTTSYPGETYTVYNYIFKRKIGGF